MSFFAQYDQQLTTDELALVDKARTFCAGPFSQAVHEAYKKNEPYPTVWISKWADLGILGLQAKHEHGGQGGSFLAKIRIAMEMAQHSFATAFTINNLQSTVTRVSQAGTDRQREELLQGLLGGKLLSAPAMTEPAGGSDLGALTATAKPVDGGFLLNGKKAWITNGMIVNCLTLLARVEGHEGQDNIASFLVQCENGPTFERRELTVNGARSFRLAELTFKDHFIPDWALFLKPGEAFKTSMAGVNAARVHVAAMAVASLYSALCEATRYCAERKTFGKPLLHHQGLSWELAEVAVRLEAANALVFRTAQHVNKGEVVLTLAAQCKKFAVDTAIWGIDQCARAMGATGFSDAHRLGMLQSEVRMSAYGDGTNEMLMDRIGRGLAKEYGGRS